jgi:hypothetical protein
MPLKNKIRHQGYCQKYRESHQEKVLFGQARYRARRKGIEFNLEVSDIVIPKLCPVLKIPLVKNSRKGGPGAGSPSLDRINNDKGYIKGNVQIISHRANTMKHCATNKELILFANWVKRTYKRVIDE